MVSLGVLSSFTFGLLRPKIFRPFYLFLFSFYYVGFGEEQIGSRRGCGVNGGLKVTILLGCMKGSCQEASRTCSRVRAVCVAIDLIVGQIRWGGGMRRGQTNQGFFSCRFGSAVEYMGIDSRKSRARGFSSPAFLAILLFLKYAFYFMLF